MSSRPLSSLGIPTSSLSALTRGGYETVADISGKSAEELAEDINISLPSSQAILYAQQLRSTQNAFPLTQSAASVANTSRVISTGYTPMDKLLSGGLPRGHILEISGPPGTPKEPLAVNIVKAFIEANEQVVFVDAQNMTTPALLNKVLEQSPNVPPDYKNHIFHIKMNTLPDLMVFMENLLSTLESRPKVSLLVLNSLSFLFQSHLSFSTKRSLLERVKNALTMACASRNLSVVITSQLSTKVLDASGSPGSFDTGTKGVMVPQLGSGYLPSGRTHRIIIAPENRTSGVLRLLSSPTYRPDGGARAPTEPYALNGGFLDFGSSRISKESGISK